MAALSLRVPACRQLGGDPAVRKCDKACINTDDSCCGCGTPDANTLVCGQECEYSGDVTGWSDCPTASHCQTKVEPALCKGFTTTPVDRIS
jgi:hypothetical protein